MPLSEAEIEDWRRRMLALERTQQTLIDNQEAILRVFDSKHRQNQASKGRRGFLRRLSTS